MKMQRVTLAVIGLGCGGGGALTVERALARLPGVRLAYVNAATEMAYVEYDLDRTDPWQLGAAVRRVGFDIEPPSVAAGGPARVGD